MSNNDAKTSSPESGPALRRELATPQKSQRWGLSAIVCGLAAITTSLVGTLTSDVDALTPLRVISGVLAVGTLITAGLTFHFESRKRVATIALGLALASFVLPFFLPYVVVAVVLVLLLLIAISA